MKKIFFARGTNVRDFFLTPTVRYNNNNGFWKYLTLEWLRWYIGFRWE